MSNESLEKILQVIRAINRSSEVVGPDVSLFTTLDFDSLQIIEVIDWIDREYEISLMQNMVDIEMIATPRKILILASSLKNEKTAKEGSD